MTSRTYNVIDLKKKDLLGMISNRDIRKLSDTEMKKIVSAMRNTILYNSSLLEQAIKSTLADMGLEVL